MLEQQLERIANALEVIAKAVSTPEKVEAPKTPVAPKAEAPKKAPVAKKEAVKPAAKDEFADEPAAPVAPAKDDAKAVDEARAKVLAMAREMTQTLKDQGQESAITMLTDFMRCKVYPRVGIKKLGDVSSLKQAQEIEEALKEWETQNMAGGF